MWGCYDLAVHVCIYLLSMDALSILHVEFDDLDDRDVSVEHGLGVRTLPDFRILMTVIRLLYIRCISTFSFSWPTTSIMFTVYSSEYLS